MTTKKLLGFLPWLLFALLVPVFAFAVDGSGADPESSVQEILPSAASLPAESTTTSESGGSEVVVQVTTPAYTYDNGSFVYDDGIAVVSDTLYGGTWSGSVLEYFAGVARKHPGTHYVAYRADQYNYYLYFGSDLSSSGYTVSGTADYLHYYSGSGVSSVSLTRGTGSVDVDCSTGFAYTDLIDTCLTFLSSFGLVSMRIILPSGFCASCLGWVYGKKMRAEALSS